MDEEIYCPISLYGFKNTGTDADDKSFVRQSWTSFPYGFQFFIKESKSTIKDGVESLETFISIGRSFSLYNATKGDTSMTGEAEIGILFYFPLPCTKHPIFLQKDGYEVDDGFGVIEESIYSETIYKELFFNDIKTYFIDGECVRLASIGIDLPQDKQDFDIWDDFYATFMQSGSTDDSFLNLNSDALYFKGEYEFEQYSFINIIDG